MIQSILDTDLYQLTQQQAILELFPKAIAEDHFILREPRVFTEEFLKTLTTRILDMQDLKLSPGEKSWLVRTCPYLKPSYLEYLQNYRFDPNSEVRVSLSRTSELSVVVSGLWHRQILWEVPLLALISEVYFEVIDKSWKWEPDKYYKKTRSKFEFLKTHDCKVADFGTRRRRSYEVQEVVMQVATPDFPNFVGTSNVHLAKRFGVKPIGTMAHKWIMAMSVLEGLPHANYHALNNWTRVYNADLGTALTDTYGLDAFLDNFNMRLSKLFDGVRHDSGDPYLFTDKMCRHYEGLDIDPLSKSLNFSNGLNEQEAVRIRKYTEGKIRCTFGVGTHLTNDFVDQNSPALNMVIKLWSINGKPVVKLTDDPRKACGDKDALRVAKWYFYNQPLDSTKEAYSEDYIKMCKGETK